MEPAKKRTKTGVNTTNDQLREDNKKLREDIKKLKVSLDWHHSGFVQLAQERTRRDAAEARARSQSLRVVISRIAIEDHQNWSVQDGCWNRFLAETQDPYLGECSTVAWRLWQEWVAKQDWPDTDIEESEESDVNN